MSTEGNLARKVNIPKQPEKEEEIPDLTEFAVEEPSEELKVKKAKSKASDKASLAALRKRLKLPEPKPTMGESVPGQHAIEGAKRRKKLTEENELRGKASEDVVFAEDITKAAGQTTETEEQEWDRRIKEAKARPEKTAEAIEEEEWSELKGEAVKSGELSAVLADNAEDRRLKAAREQDEFDAGHDKAMAYIAESAADQAAAGMKQKELPYVQKLSSENKIGIFSEKTHADLKVEFDKLTDAMSALKPWNFLKRRALEKQVTEVMRKMDMNFDRYSALKMDLARAEHDVAEGDPRLKKVFEAQVKQLRDELAPMEAAVSEATHEDMADRAAERKFGGATAEDQEAYNAEAKKTARASRLRKG